MWLIMVSNLFLVFKAEFHRTSVTFLLMNTTGFSSKAYMSALTIEIMQATKMPEKMYINGDLEM